MIQLWTLPNGLRIIGQKLPYLRTVSIGVYLHAGSLMESDTESGLSHMMEHMAFKGTPRRSARQLAEEIDLIGGHLNAFTSRDCTCFHAHVIDEDLPQALDMISDIILNATISTEELDKERGVVLEEIAMDEDTPEEIVSDLLDRACFGNTPLGRPVLGSQELVRGYSREDLLSYRSARYAPRETVVSLCGSYDENTICELVSRYFGDWQHTIEPFQIPATRANTGVRLFREKDTEQLHLNLAYPGCAYGDNRANAQSLLTSVLGGAMSSRLFQRIRDELGMAYSIYAYNAGCEGTGTLCIYAGVSPKNGERVLCEIDSEIRKLLKDGLTEKEFVSTKRQMRTGFLMSLESTKTCMHFNGRQQLILNRIREPQESLSYLEAVTYDDVMEIANEVLSVKPCLAVVGQEAGKFRMPE